MAVRVGSPPCTSTAEKVASPVWKSFFSSTFESIRSGGVENFPLPPDPSPRVGRLPPYGKLATAALPPGTRGACPEVVTE